MAFNFLERLGTMLGQRVAERVLSPREQAAEPAPAAEAVPAEAETEAPAAEAPPAEAHAEPAAETYPAPETYTAPAPAPEAVSASEATSYAPAEAAVTAPEPAPAAETSTAPEPVAEAVAAPEAATLVEAAAPVAPVKSEEELEEERLWNETGEAWSSGDFARVTTLLDRLRALQPEDAAEIDEKIAAAQFNQASAFEQSGDLERALYLFQEAQRRNPNLGEASYAIERIQAQLQPPPATAEPEPAPPAEQTYSVESGDTLSAIAERFYGDANEWPRIFDANRDQLDNPDLIQPGQVLCIPS
jgi:nucleoid-associated protein YgaU